MSSRVVIVGHCASGKTTLVERLRVHGVDASAVGQEHSDIDDLWNHYSPDVVVFLDVSLDVVRKRRRNPDWPEWIFELQTERLEAARKRADVEVDTTVNDADETFRIVWDHLQLTAHP